MTRLSIDQLEWLASVVLLSAILLLATRIDLPTWIARESAASGPLAAPVTCVPPATADDRSSTSASVSDTTIPDCESSGPEPFRTAWMSAC